MDVTSRDLEKVRDSVSWVDVGVRRAFFFVDIYVFIFFVFISYGVWFSVVVLSALVLEMLGGMCSVL